MEVFHHTRTSICPECRRLIGADLVQVDGGLILDKFCPDHGSFRTRIAGDYAWLNGRGSFAAERVKPARPTTAVKRGCPADCGECAGHRQKSAFFLFELTDICDLSCPVCLSGPQEKRRFISPADAEAMVKSVLDYAGPGQIITLGGGEPTLHPQFFELVSILRRSGMSEIWVYTNGRRIAREPDFARQMAEHNLYIVLQWDGFSDAIYTVLRGRSLLGEKTLALKNLQQSRARIGLCPTVVSGVNDHELGRIYNLFMSDGSFGTLDIATMAYVGNGDRFTAGIENRTTSQDVLVSLERQTRGRIRESDFSPISFSHPECLQICYLFQQPDGGFFPLKRFLDPTDYEGLIRNKPLLGLSPEVEGLFKDLINRMWAKGTENPDVSIGLKVLRHMIDTLFPRGHALSETEFALKSAALVKVILVHSYMDGLNFDIGRTKMCISRTVLPDGRLMPTCAYNVIHRNKRS